MTKDDWIVYNSRTNTYDTRDGTCIPAELVDSANRLVDILFIATLREKQRKEMKEKNGTKLPKL